ncbi:hypothetical protein SmJEL517_g00218 [Synchytrium microbalum]|uniref:Uncharacterized protein n=1 Tax=Synchytrium microbalum TaxID=1806994 RepID=A0A507CEF1_9FUNG|nr:uncharacterized protein SmJEL517_g00218 [Synchytrium microbalum]TPX38002.1 hypothetical protein SmJEL517_g00218 [Synchytrium microbalum]
MAAIIKELWGVHPSFLKLKTSKNLFRLCLTLPNLGTGVRVIPSSWHKNGLHDSYWTITSVEFNPDWRSGTVWGIQTWKNSTAAGQIAIPRAAIGSWHLYQPPSMHRQLADKLDIKIEQPTATSETL